MDDRRRKLSVLVASLALAVGFVAAAVETDLVRIPNSNPSAAGVPDFKTIYQNCCKDRTVTVQLNAMSEFDAVIGVAEEPGDVEPLEPIAILQSGTQRTISFEVPDEGRILLGCVGNDPTGYCEYRIFIHEGK